MPAPDPPLVLRPSRTATDLKAAHDPPETGMIDETGARRVDFIVDEAPGLTSWPSGDGGLTPRPALPLHSWTSMPVDAAHSNSNSNNKPRDPSKWKAALGEAQYFAGGLISRPAESTRHHSIIRHGSSLIWYRGPTTSVSITVLADQPLPPARSVWLQRKGFSGAVGMTLKALARTTGSWVDVTPTARAAPEHLAEMDERAVQRDLRRFAKRAAGSKAAGHTPRETCVVRIPASAADGYFRLVVCAGGGGDDDDPQRRPEKKVLCGSPVFRVASTSTDVSVVRGASLRTMPLELGVKVASAVGRQMAMSYAGTATGAVQGQIGRIVPVGDLQTAGSFAQFGYDHSRLGASISESVERGMAAGGAGAGGGTLDPLIVGEVLDTPVTIIGSDSGPSPPFPLKFEGKVVPGTGQSTLELGMPTANLSGVPDSVKHRLDGVFAAWATVVPSKGLEHLSPDWHEAIVTVAPHRSSGPSVVQKKTVSAHIIHDFAGASLVGARLQVLLMGHLHPAVAAAVEDLVEELHLDTATTLASLAREAWGPMETVARMSTLKSERSFSQRVTDATGQVRQQVDRVPLHWAGVRSESGTLRDQTFGKGGLWIPRDGRP